MEYEYKESYNLGSGNIIVEEKEFTTKKDARDYLNLRVKKVKEDKSWKTYYTDNSEFFYEKELRKAEHIKLENEGKFDIGDCNIYYAFEIESKED